MRYLLITFLIGFSIISKAQYKSEVWCPDNGDGTYTNPIINADYSDPDVIAVGEDYYLTASSFNCMPGLPILHSRDLVNWEIIGHALTHQFSFRADVAHGKGVWAPSIRYHNNEFYIYWGDPDHGVYMVKTDNPAGVWSDPLLVIAGEGIIDTTPLWDDDGRCYLVNAYAGSRSGFNSVLAVRELSADGTRAISNPVIVFDGGSENRTAEGPKLYKRDGWYWIMCPAGGVATGWQLAMRSRNIYGPYEHRTVMMQGDTNINGPHQGAWVHTEFGEDWFVHFQDKGAYGRVVHLQPMAWTDGFPIMGEPQEGKSWGTPVAKYRKPKSNSTLVFNPAESDEFNAPMLGTQWQWQSDYQQSFGMPTSFGVMRLFTTVIWSYKSMWNMPNLMLQKLPAEEFTATTKVRFTAKANLQGGGIVMMGMDYSALMIQRTDDKFILFQQTCVNADDKGVEQNKQIATFSPTGNDNIDYKPALYIGLYLRMVVSKGICQFYYSEDNKQYIKAGEPFKMREGKWIGAKMGFIAQQIKDKEDRGWIDVDWFRVTKNK